MNFLDEGETIPNTTDFKAVLKDYRRIFFAMKKMLDPTYTYQYINRNNEKLEFNLPNQTLQIDDNILLDKIVQNNTRIVDGRQGVNPQDPTREDSPFYYYISLAEKAIFPKLNGNEINASISNFFMTHELSHIVYRKLFEKCNRHIIQSGLTEQANRLYNLSSLFKRDNELNFRPRTQSKEILCDIFGIIILWVASLIDEPGEFTTINLLIKLFGNLTVESIRTSQVPEIVFLGNEFGTGSESHPSCAKRLLTIKYVVSELSKLHREVNERNIYNFLKSGIDALNKFHILNSGNDNYHQLVNRHGYIDYQPIPINHKWNTFETTATPRGGSRKTKSVKRKTNKKNTKRHKKNKSKMQYSIKK